MKTEILTLLRETDGYVSGQELCEKFGVSRTAVWKAINQLKEAGYEIEAVQNKGYRLVSVPDILSESELQSVRKTRWIGEKIAFFDVVDSTNTRAKQLAEEGAPNGTYVIAERQDAGKGRRGRGFDSPAGQGIWMTLVLKPEIDPNHASMITLVTALAVSKGLRSKHSTFLSGLSSYALHTFLLSFPAANILYHTSKLPVLMCKVLQLSF